MKTYLTNAQIILSNYVLENASLLIEDGTIAAINPVVTSNAKAIDLNGKTVMPGMIDLHCDAIEKEIEPRPGALFPIPFAVAQIDKRNAMAGITTPFHAISFAHEELGVRNNDIAAEVVRSIHAYQPYALVDNHVHCRYEITDPTGLPILLDLLAEDCIHLISLMDHTPGQGQFKDLQAYQNYMTRTYKKTAAEVEAMANKKIQNAEDAKSRIKTLISKALHQNIQIASHDDDTPERVEMMANMGVRLSEFPINLETAKAAKANRLFTIFGAPNILRGKSQSGSIKAIEAVNNQVASCLCSDYAPATLLAAVFRLPEISELSLPQAIALVTHNPAQALKLHDRGEIAVGKRADLLAVELVNNLPQVITTWVKGKAVYRIIP
ncbi:alpha-D-ribose 1-methylphosphonate 5-triphosphate diphosphatase [Iningainema tapete]|uniref:Alpha-D-ribose 1-methylphosphonate 5-triphosphate diphosphatase n=1 Tax=Iningainema tapete BLCC-T55 TaxID=2748662 RepID=A0A8J6XKW5_9CYAN|nr:alpha-D-ribose 1-methylphosphonate 5-triphosphate diphosphatase [Iningainema tapete]MBD2772716.1 alpha-D-ribose 1-methylphosphonate 5-triphosphate diphosphatase [Iningainema tapete BLCC-T55]